MHGVENSVNKEILKSQSSDFPSLILNFKHLGEFADSSEFAIPDALLFKVPDVLIEYNLIGCI